VVTFFELFLTVNHIKNSTQSQKIKNCIIYGIFIFIEIMHFGIKYEFSLFYKVNYHIIYDILPLLSLHFTKVKPVNHNGKKLDYLLLLLLLLLFNA